ncbi:MAG: Zn-ribbon domain-containing OB-fold protein [Candidatus Thorarchaeota archaeon]
MYCENVLIPPRSICPYCGPESQELVEISVEPTGEVVSYTSLERPPEGFDPPVVLALVQTNSGATILCLGSKDEIEGTKIGSQVSITKDSQGRFLYKLEK